MLLFALISHYFNQELYAIMFFWKRTGSLLVRDTSLNDLGF